MPAGPDAQIRKLPSGKWQLRYVDREGKRRSGGAFASKSEARAHYRDIVRAELDGHPAARRDVTLSELVDVFLERHATVAEPRTIETLRWRLRRPLDAYGDVPLAELERMTDELAGFAADSRSVSAIPSWARFGRRARRAFATAT
jgi:hypothetical protein